MKKILPQNEYLMCFQFFGGCNWLYMSLYYLFSIVTSLVDLKKHGLGWFWPYYQISVLYVMLCNTFTSCSWHKLNFTFMDTGFAERLNKRTDIMAHFSCITLGHTLTWLEQWSVQASVTADSTCFVVRTISVTVPIL